MIKSKMLILYWLTALLFVGACVTVNIYFPAAKVEKAAEQIVDDVYGIKPMNDSAVPADTAPTDQEQSSSLEHFLSLLGPAPAHAQDAASVSNAAIRGLKSQIAEDHSSLAPYYAAGNVGINNTGLLEIRKTDGLAMADLANLKRLVNADNAARKSLYREVAAAMNIDPSQTGQVQKIFADEWRDKAPAGWQIQDDGGAWRTK